MLSDTYAIRYICPKCGCIAPMWHYGAKSDIMGSLKYVLRSKYCTECANAKRKASLMDVLDVECVIYPRSENMYYVSWMCSKCKSSWTSCETLRSIKAINGIVKQQNARCNNNSCKPELGDIRIRSMQVL